MKAENRERVKDVVFAAAAVTGAVLLRFWSLTDLGLTHFDEGAYAATGRWVATWGLEGWAFQAGQSPGLFPVLLGIAFLVFGVHDYVAVGVSAAAGGLTVGLVYWMGRRWSGRAAGVAAALFLATCEYHLIYSRLALTDAVFSLFFWAAAAAFLIALEGGSARWFATAGALTALAWNTKYHGFLPLALALVWAVGCRIWSRGGRTVAGSGGFRTAGFAIAGSVAALGILPWVAAVGLTLGWGDVLRGFWDHTAGQESLIVTRPAVIAFYLGRWMGLPLLALGFGGALLAAIKGRRAELYFGFVSFAVLAAALFYLSFPRLLLPSVVGLCLTAGAAVARLSRAMPRRMGRHGLAALIALLALVNLHRALPVLELKTDCYRRAARRLQEFPGPVLTQMGKNFYFYGEEPFVEMRFQDPAHLERLARENREVVLAFDPIVDKLPAVRAWIDRHRSALEPILRIRIEAYEPVFYQGFDPLAAGSAARDGADFGDIEVFVLSWPQASTVGPTRQ